MIVGFFLVLQGPQLADQPGKLELGQWHLGPNTPSPLTPVSAPLQREAEVEFVTYCVHQVIEHFQLEYF